MKYTQYDKYGNVVTPTDLQNKTIWCKNGERIEEVFVSKYGGQLNLSINPEKSINKYAPDLICSTGIADLKTQNTPFFNSEKLYGIDPSYAVVFNRKDAERYWRLYRDIVIYFWVQWQSVKIEMGNIQKEVEYIEGVWSITFADLLVLLRVAPEHYYRQRVADKTGNAKSSFILDVRNPAFNKVS